MPQAGERRGGGRDRDLAVWLGVRGGGAPSSTDETARPTACGGCDLPGGLCCYVLLDGGAEALAQAEHEELVGRRVTLTPEDGLNLARIG